jgi:DNA-binding transcriptional ArsR family regulator
MERLAHKFSALSDETRLMMFEHLAASGEASAGDLGALTDISGPAVSRHLKVLREAGLVTQRASGTHRIYAARPDAVLQIADWTEKHRKFWGASLDRLDSLLAREIEGDDQ